VRLVDSDIYVRRHPHPSAGGALNGALLSILDDAGLDALLDEDGCIAGFRSRQFETLPVEALTALSDTGLVRTGSWVRFDAGGFTFRVKFKGHHVLVLDTEDHTQPPQEQE